jgi:hypothetical protein
MNGKLLIIVGALVFLLVIFGRNPVEEAKQRAAARKQGKDALILSIEEHNAKQPSSMKGFGSFGMFQNQGGSNGSTFARPGGGSGNAQPPNYPPYMYSSHGSRNQPQNAPRTTGNRMYAPETVVDQNGQPMYDQNGELLDQTKQGYYPPPPLPGTNPQQRYRRLPPRGEMHFKLPNGQPLGFRDMDVYTVDASGKTIPMPDGVYPIYDGQTNLIVSGGKSIVINN